MIVSIAGLVLVLTAVVVYVLTLPRWLVRVVSRLAPSILFELPTSEKLIAMTIDDSPSPMLTHEILKVLKKHDCKATFFIIGSQAEQCPDVLRQMHADGHELANHTMHDKASFRLPPNELERQIDSCDELLSKYQGQSPASAGGQQPNKWFRPGHGWVTPGMLDLCRRKGYHLTLGSVFGNDPWVKSPALLKWYYTQWAYPGAIMILHDGLDPSRYQTVEVLDTVLPRLKKQGYKVTTVSELYLASGRAATKAAKKAHST